jgi:hypothetical protein
MTEKDPYIAYRRALTRYANLRESLVWASAYGIWDEEYLKIKRRYEKARVTVNRTVGDLMRKAKEGVV